MSWQPPPSFSTPSPKSKTYPVRDSTSKTPPWAPVFWTDQEVNNREAATTPTTLRKAQSEDLQLSKLNAVTAAEIVSSTSLASPRQFTSPRQFASPNVGSNKKKNYARLDVTENSLLCDMPLSNLNDVMAGKLDAIISAIPTAKEVVQQQRQIKQQQRMSASTFPPGSPREGMMMTSRPVKKKVGWNQRLFVANQDSAEAEDLSSSDSEEKSDYEIEIPSRADLGLGEKFISKSSLLIVDKQVLRTRLEWSQLLMSQAFKAYRHMLCAVDDDLPSPKEMEELEENNAHLLYERKELSKVRDEMLDDPELTEREIAAFFEGFKIFQMKLNSLQSQLDGMKAMQKLGLRSQIDLHRNFATSSERISMVNYRNASLPQLDALCLENREEGTSPLLPLPETPIKSRRDAESPVEPTFRALASQPPITPRKEEVSSGGTPSRGMKASRSLRQMSIRRIKETTSKDGNEDIRKLLDELEEAERRQKKLEKQLAQAGVSIAEDIPYEIAKDKVASIARRMEEIGGSDAADKGLQEEYFQLEKDMEKYISALQLTDEWLAEQEELERKWEASVAAANQEAIRQLRRHMPVDVRNQSEAALCSHPTPNGKYLPKKIAQKFKRTNVLQLLRMDPNDIVRMHAATLENMRITGLTLTERRAMYEHIKVVGPKWKAMQGDKMTERKWTWYNMMKSNFKENVNAWQRHVDEYGPPGNHPYATAENPKSGCPFIGKQCPLKADKIIDYEGDYGFPEGPDFYQAEVKKSEVDNISKTKQDAQEAIKTKKSVERREALMKHYDGKILQVSLANGSCESMDEAIDSIVEGQEKWIRIKLASQNRVTDESKKKEVAVFNEILNEVKVSILQFAARSGMQLTGKRDANADHPDMRSIVELGLCEEVIESAIECFRGMEGRMEELQIKDGRMKITLHELQSLLEELHERNICTISKLGVERPVRSRPLKLCSAIEADVKKTIASEENLKQQSEQASPITPPNEMPSRGGPGRGDLLSALKGRGRGGGPGRGDLLSALQGRGGRGRGGDGGRGELLAAIAARSSGDD